MCDPLTIAGIALTGVSTAANYMAQSRVQDARDDAMAAERIRQQGLDREADAINEQSQDRYEDFEGKQTETSNSLADYFVDQEMEAPTADAALPPTASNIVVQEQQKQQDKAKAFTDKTGAALGQLRSFGDLLGDTSRLQARDASRIGQIGRFKQGSSNVLGYELDAANSAGGALGMIGDIAGGLGGVATSAGLSGGSLGNLFGGTAPAVRTGGMAAGRIADRASVPGYAGNSYSIFGR